MIKLSYASRWYGEVIGVNDINCTIGPGLTALLGLNGAGKTTLIRLITGQLKPTTGEVEVLGEAPFANPNVFRQMGYCPEIDNFYEDWSGRKFVQHMGRLAGYSASETKNRAEEMLTRVGMVERASRPIKGYSKGMRQRIKLAQAMIHDPKIIILDEPLNGLDPGGRQDIINLLGWLADQGKCVIISSHILYEVEQMTRSLILLSGGRLLATGDLRVIRDFIDTQPHRVYLASSNPRKVMKAVADLPTVLSVELASDDAGVQLQVKDPNSFYDSLSELVLTQSLPVESFHSPDNSLEAVFNYLIKS